MFDQNTQHYPKYTHNGNGARSSSVNCIRERSVYERALAKDFFNDHKI